MTVFLGTLWSAVKEVKAAFGLMWNMKLVCTQCWEFAPHLTVTGKSNGFSRVVVGTSVIFLSYNVDGPSRLLFVKQHQDSCVVVRDTSRFSLRGGRAIVKHANVRRETQGPFPVATYWDSYQFSRGFRHCLLLKI